MSLLPRLPALLASLLLLFGLASGAGADGGRLSAEAVIDGLKRTVFGAEIPGPFSRTDYLRKFAGPVRFHIAHHAERDRRPALRRFIERLERDIAGLETETVASPEEADFVVHTVDRKDYQRVGRAIYGDPAMRVPGHCIVRSDYGRRGIDRSDALIVSDEGEELFRRCMIEEILQGLGPLNDAADAERSVFNDDSRVSEFTPYDRAILSMLYDPRLKPGMTSAQAEPLLPAVAATVLRRIGGG